MNSGQRRARAQLAQALPAEEELAETTEADRRAVLERFAAAIENADATALAELLREDVTLEMPPLLTWFAGRQAVARVAASHLLTGPGRLRLVPVTANGQAAFAVYQREPGGAYHAHAGLLASFGLPREDGPTAAGPAPGQDPDRWAPSPLPGRQGGWSPSGTVS